jgi:carboxymethylenebutenolidase
MNRLLKILLLVTVVIGIVTVIASRRGHATSPEVAPSMNMTAAEHIEHLKAMSAAGDIHAGHALDELARGVAQAAPANAKLPADDMGVVARLASSPRKGEYVNIMFDGKPMRTWVVHPAGNGKAPVVVVIMEIFGLSDWIRGVADQLAAEGFIAVAPDIVVGHGKDGGDTTSLADVPQAQLMQAVLAIPPAERTAKLKAAREWGLKDPRSNGKSGVVGFCFGGTESFALAVAEPGLNAAVVYYGTSPTDAPPPARGTPPGPYVVSDSVANVKAPIIGFYGGLMQDARVGNTVAPTEAKMKALGKTYEPHIFDGAAHGFLRAQTGNDGANMKATEQAWPMTVAWLKKYTS